MRIVIVSDTHSQHHNVRVPPGDVLIHAGDVTWQGDLHQYASLSNWMMDKPHKHKILIPGNHDTTFETVEHVSRNMFAPEIKILISQGCEVEGLRFYGSPYTPRFFDWAFNVDRDSDQLREIWEHIPDDVNVLITHGPPYGILDRNCLAESCGCKLLLERVRKLKELRLHVFGHIHEGYGTFQDFGVQFVNASICTVGGRPKNAPIVVDL